MTINAFILHRIDKEQHRDPVVTLRNRPLKTTDSKVLRFTEIAIDVFKTNAEKPSSVFADFNADTVNYPVSDWCIKYFGGTKSLAAFSKDCTNRLAHCMKLQHASTGGYVIFADITFDSKRRLFVIMLHPQDGLAINAKLEFKDVSHLELRHIDKAALVTEPTNGAFERKPVTYAGFRKEMSLYFQEFIGPDVFRNPAKDSSELIDRLDDYAHLHSFSESQIDSVRIGWRQYAATCAANGTELELSVLSTIANPQQPNAFALYAAQNGVSALIKPDPGVFKRWRTIKHTSSDGLVLQFKAELIGQPGTNHRLELDKAAKTITIKNIEDDLISKIDAAKG